MARPKRINNNNSGSRRKNRSGSGANGTRPARFSVEDRERAISMVLRGERRRKVAEEIGCSTETLRLWLRKAEEERRGAASAVGAEDGPRASVSGPTEASTPAQSPPTAPKDPGAGLGEAEVAAILELKKRHPAMGPAQIRAQLKRFKGWRVALRAIARALRQNGYELEHRGGRPVEDEPPVSWEAPHRNALWQLDFAEVRIPEGRRALGVILDDFSRYIVGYGLFESPTTEDVVRMLREAIRLHGKPFAIYTDRGGPFLAWGKEGSLGRFLEEELIDHHTTPAYRPQGRGKVEAVIHTLKRELWEVEHFASEEIARERLESFVDDYNHRRAHLALSGLTPADRFFGRWEKVLAWVEAESRKRQGASELREHALSSEPRPHDHSEVLTLIAVGGELELRFLGHRVRLGSIES